MTTAVVVFHSDVPRLATTLESLRGQVSDLIVVDVSPDGSADVVASDTVRVLARPENRGYGWACNLGVAAALDDPVLISNPDVVYEPGSVAALADAAAAGGLCAPLQTARPGSRSAADTAQSLQMGISVGASANRWLGVGRHRFLARCRALLADPPPVLPVPDGMTLSGASLMATRATWKRLGGFDERFFLYQEDADLTVRCRRAGLRVDLVPDAPVFHESGTTRAGLDPRILGHALVSEREAWRAHGLPVGLLVLIQTAGIVVRCARDGLRGHAADARVWLRMVRATVVAP